MTELEKTGAAAKAAGRVLSVAGTKKKNAALEAIALALEAGSRRILDANAEDIANAEKAGLKKSFMDRLLLTEERIAAIAAGVREVAALPDPIGEVISMSD